MAKLKLTKESKPIQREHDVLLIAGDGKKLREDLHGFYGFDVAHDTLCIGRSIQVVDSDILHYADIDADEGKWVVENLHKTYPDKINGKLIKHTLGEVDWFDIGWNAVNEYIPSETNMWHGSTSFFAVLIALEMGYKRIVLAGCPMDAKGHWYFENQTYGPKWDAETYQVWFEFAAEEYSRKVRSMSGYTKTLLGKPEGVFFNGVS